MDFAQDQRRQHGDRRRFVEQIEQPPARFEQLGADGAQPQPCSAASVRGGGRLPWAISSAMVRRSRRMQKPRQGASGLARTTSELAGMSSEVISK